MKEDRMKLSLDPRVNVRPTKEALDTITLVHGEEIEQAMQIYLTLLSDPLVRKIEVVKIAFLGRWEKEYEESPSESWVICVKVTVIMVSVFGKKLEVQRIYPLPYRIAHLEFQADLKEEVLASYKGVVSEAISLV